MAKRPKRYGGGNQDRDESLGGSRHGGQGAYRRASEADAWERQQELQDDDLDLDQDLDRDLGDAGSDRGGQDRSR